MSKTGKGKRELELNPVKAAEPETSSVSMIPVEKSISSDLVSRFSVWRRKQISQS